MKYKTIPLSDEKSRSLFEEKHAMVFLSLNDKRLFSSDEGTVLYFIPKRIRRVPL